MRADMKRKRQANSVHENRDFVNGSTEVAAAFSKVDEPTLLYFKEIRAHLDEAEEEQRSTLATNALLEAVDKVETLGSDPACSRILETLLPLAAPDTVEAFALGALNEENFIILASSPCGSHVLERLCETLAAMDSEKAHKVLVGAANTVAGKLYEFSTDRFASHVARSIVGLAAGIDVQNLQGVRSEAPVKTQSQGSTARKGLRAKVGLKSGELAVRSVDKELLEPIQHALLRDGFRGALMEELPYHQYGSPFLQTVLLASQGNDDFLCELIPKLFGSSSSDAASSLSSLQVEDVHGLMQDRTSSHLFEVILSVAPAEILEQIEHKFFRNHLAYLAMHPVANFVVQALLGSITKSPQMKAVVKELRGSFPTLLRSKRSGVVSAALAAAVRTATGQVDLSKALSAALRDLPGNQQSPAAALLTLDMAIKLDGMPLNRRLSTLGCTALTAVLAFTKEGSAEFIDSFLDLPAQQMARVAADPGGSRVMEALLQSPSVNAKAKKKLLKKLTGYYGTIASTPAGNFLVEKCYSFAGLKDKEAVAQDLAKSESELAATPRGMKLLLRCQVAEFKRNSEKWRSHVKSAEALQQDFADLIDEPKPDADAEAPASKEVKDPAAKSDKKAKKRKKLLADSDGDAITPTTTKLKGSNGEDVPSTDTKGENEATGIEIVQAPQDPSREAEEQEAAEPQEAVFTIEVEADAAPKKKKQKKAKKVEQEQAADPQPSSTVQDATLDNNIVDETEGSPTVLQNDLEAGNKPSTKRKKKSKVPKNEQKEGSREVSILEEASKDGVLTTLQVFEDKVGAPKKLPKSLKRNRRKHKASRKSR